MTRAWARQGLAIILQAPQGLGRLHLIPKVTSADKVRNITGVGGGGGRDINRTTTALAQKSQAQATW